MNLLYVSPRIKIGDFLIDSSVFIFIFFSILSTSFYYQYFISQFKWIILFSIILILLRELMTSYSIKTLTGIIVVVLMFFITFRNSGGLILFPISFVFIYCLRNIPFYRSCKLFLISTVIALVFVITSSLFGVIPNYIQLEMHRTRYFLGFLYALYAPTYMTNITLILVYLKGKSFDFLTGVILFVVNYWLYTQTGSRLTFFSSILLIAIGFIYRFFPKFFEMKILFLLIFSFLFCFFLSYIFSINYNPNNQFYKVLDTVFENRVRLASDSMRTYSFSLFGQVISWTGSGLNVIGQKVTNSNYNYVDNMYIIILQKYGLLFSLVFTGLVTFLLRKLYVLNDKLLIVLFSIIAFHAVIDDLVLYLHYNVLWLVFAVFFNEEYLRRNE